MRDSMGMQQSCCFLGLLSCVDPLHAINSGSLHGCCRYAAAEPSWMMRRLILSFAEDVLNQLKREITSHECTCVENSPTYV